MAKIRGNEYIMIEITYYNKYLKKVFNILQDMRILMAPLDLLEYPY